MRTVYFQNEGRRQYSMIQVDPSHRTMKGWSREYQITGRDRRYFQFVICLLPWGTTYLLVMWSKPICEPYMLWSATDCRLVPK